MKTKLAKKIYKGMVQMYYPDIDVWCLIDTSQVDENGMGKLIQTRKEKFNPRYVHYPMSTS